MRFAATTCSRFFPGSGSVTLGTLAAACCHR